jgi:hypothetical protein
MLTFQLGFFPYEVLNEIVSFGYLVLFSISGLAVILITIHFSNRGLRILDVTSKLLGSAAAVAVLHDKFSKSTNGGGSSGDDKNKDDKNKDEKNKDEKNKDDSSSNKNDKSSDKDNKPLDNKSSDGNNDTKNQQSSSKK